jgi:hypothetical protein
MKSHPLARFALLATLPLLLTASEFNGGGYTVVAWNDLGMHCMDDDYSVFSLLPPFNTINAQLINPQGDLVTNASGISLTYQAVADPDGSFNSTGAGKTNFWDYTAALYGSVATDGGLFGSNMPGLANTPQPMAYEAAHEWWIAPGIPLPPIDDQGRPNSYPMMEVVARTTGGNFLASTQIVLPVSSEMDCRACHGSGTPAPAGAEPASGWVDLTLTNEIRDYRLNVLKVHDEHRLPNPADRSSLGSPGFSPANLYTEQYKLALSEAGYSPKGLYDQVAVQGSPVLCAQCHISNALPVPGVPGVSDLTHALHTRHAAVINPQDGLSMDSSLTRSSCYQCHPGSDTRCLRGAMGAAISPDGSLAMDCQSCHGNMTTVGSSSRAGWFDEPGCQQCHTGTATDNNGQIRYTSVYEAIGVPRTAVNNTFATTPDAPAPGISLYRFSAGHGGLQCSACHGSTHAVYPSSHRNDNIQSLSLQGHVGTVADCTSCHDQSPDIESWTQGPHGLHPVSNKWARDHGDAAKVNNAANCKTCHGTDLKGTVLSRALGDRTFTDNEHGGIYSFYRGETIGCWSCHNVPVENGDGTGPGKPNPNPSPVVPDDTLAVPFNTPTPITLTASDNNPVTFRILNQPAGGSVALTGTIATYTPFTGFTGFDSFTYVANDGSTDSNRGVISVTVGSITLTKDTDGDGMSDFFEYALGLYPNFPNSTKPEITLTNVAPGDDRLTASLSRCCTPVDTTLTIEVSSDLKNWFSGSPYTSTQTDDPTSLIIRDESSTATDSKRFMRIKAAR